MRSQKSRKIVGDVIDMRRVVPFQLPVFAEDFV